MDKKHLFSRPIQSFPAYQVGPRNLRNPWLINYLRAFGIFTLVESALQIGPICTNKPNFRKSQMYVNKVITTDYDKMDTWSIRKNKPNSNPIQSQFKPNQSQNKPNTNPNKANFRGKKMLLHSTIYGLRKRGLIFYVKSGLASQPRKGVLEIPGKYYIVRFLEDCENDLKTEENIAYFSERCLCRFVYLPGGLRGNRKGPCLCEG
jgi:hypothetical protein